MKRKYYAAGILKFSAQYGGYIIFSTVIIFILVWLQQGAPPLLAEATFPNETVSEDKPDTIIELFEATPTRPLVKLDQIPIIENTDLVPALNPFNIQTKHPIHEFITYTVKLHDTPNGISDKFNIKPETLLGGNPQLSDEASLLQVDMNLIILPIDGVIHTVRRGDSLDTISQKYAVDVEEITNYTPNNLEFPYRLVENTRIVVPGGIFDDFSWKWTPPPPPAALAGRALVRGTGTFVWPVSARRITQTYWYAHRGVDVGLPVGSPAFASDRGTVIWSDWNITGYGNLIVLDHGNGFQTFYAHLSGYNVYVGQVVEQGQIIGYTGNSGNSSGPHIHFEIRLNGSHQNPFWPGYLQ